MHGLGSRVVAKRFLTTTTLLSPPILLFDITQRIENIGSFTSIIFITLDIVLVLGEISSR